MATGGSDRKLQIPTDVPKNLMAKINFRDQRMNLLKFDNNRRQVRTAAVRHVTEA